MIVAMPNVRKKEGKNTVVYFLHNDSITIHMHKLSMTIQI